MSRFLEALSQAEQARKDQEKKPDPKPEVKVNGIGGAAAWLLRDQLPESPESDAKLESGRVTGNGKNRSPLNSHPSTASKHSAVSIQHSAEEEGDRRASETPSLLTPQLSPPSTAQPSPSSLDQHLVSLVSPSSFEADQYRTLRHIVEQKRAEAGVHMIAITSPAVGDGKTLTSINLAGALAQAPHARVLLIDADLRRPSICRQLGIRHAQRKGLVDAVLNSSVSLAEIVTDCEGYNLSVVCSGPAPSPPYEVLKSPRLGELLQEARSRFDFIVIDTPPLVPFPDCRLIENWVDGFLLVMSAHKTPQAQFEEGTSALDEQKIMGIVFNSDETLAPAKYNFYYKYQRRARRGWNPFRKRSG